MTPRAHSWCRFVFALGSAGWASACDPVPAPTVPRPFFLPEPYDWGLYSFAVIRECTPARPTATDLLACKAQHGLDIPQAMYGPPLKFLSVYPDTVRVWDEPYASCLEHRVFGEGWGFRDRQFGSYCGTFGPPSRETVWPMVGTIYGSSQAVGNHNPTLMAEGLAYSGRVDADTGRWLFGETCNVAWVARPSSSGCRQFATEGEPFDVSGVVLGERIVVHKHQGSVIVTLGEVALPPIRVQSVRQAVPGSVASELFVQAPFDVTDATGSVRVWGAFGDCQAAGWLHRDGETTFWYASPEAVLWEGTAWQHNAAADRPLH